MYLLKSRIGVFSLVNLSMIGHAESINKLQSKMPDGDRPNIIFILTDDQRMSAMGYAGNRDIHTPEMDRLAREGVYFKNAFAILFQPQAGPAF